MKPQLRTRTLASSAMTTLAPGAWMVELTTTGADTTILSGDGARQIAASPDQRPVSTNDWTSGREQVVQDLEFRFKCLTERWRKERSASSSIAATAMCPAYQSIIALGEEALPLILRQMKSEGDQPDMWFWALQVIADENPVPEGAQGDFPAMAEAWLRWGEERNLDVQ